MAPEPEKEYTMEEVANHNKVGDCWLVVGNDNTGKAQINSPFLSVKVYHAFRRVEMFDQASLIGGVKLTIYLLLLEEFGGILLH